MQRTTTFAVQTKRPSKESQRFLQEQVPQTSRINVVSGPVAPRWRDCIDQATTRRMDSFPSRHDCHNSTQSAHLALTDNVNNAFKQGNSQRR